MSAFELAQWVPMRMYWDGERPMVDWCHLGSARFSDPFFDETIEKRLADPFALLFRHQTPADLLTELRSLQPGLPPTGFIFHMSRCGSTLVAQMLAAVAQNIVISEASPIDWVLRAHFRNPAVTDAERSLWLQGLVNALGQRRAGQEERYFIKFDAWHIMELPLIRCAFPDVPWIFLYRDPVEVMVSHDQHKGIQMVPGALPPAVAGLELPDAASMSADDYGAHILSRICQAALRYGPQGGRLIHYPDLPGAAWSTMFDHFRLKCGT